MNIDKKIYLTPLLLSLGTIQQVNAAGFALIEDSASGMGNAFAGAAATAEDASTIFYNPAGLARLEKRQIVVAGHIVAPTADYTDTGSSINPAFTGGTQFPGSLRGANDDGAKIGIIPNFYYSQPINETLTFGLGLNAPYGLATEYDDNWVGRYHAIHSSVETININPSLGFKITDSLSFGFGINAQYVKAKLSQAIDSAAVCLQATTAATCAALGVGASEVASGNVDSKGELEADGWAWGFNFGVLYDITDKTRVGASYRSGMDHDTSGDAEFTITPGLQPVLAGANAQLALINKALLVNSDINASISLPDTVSLSFAHQTTPKLQLLADLTWTGWSSFEELRINYASGQDDSVTDESWNDTLRYSLGLNYKYNNKLTLRTGVAYDETPVPNEAHRTPRIPGNDRTWLSVGAGYELSESLHFDVGYSHLFVSDTDTNHTDDKGYTLAGTYEADVDILSAQVRWSF